MIHLVTPGSAADAARYSSEWVYTRCGVRVEMDHGYRQAVTCPDCLALEEDDASFLRSYGVFTTE